MFSLYGINGLNFSGTLESLLGGRKVEEVRAQPQSAGTGTEGQEAGNDLRPGSGEREAAKEAYRHAVDWHKRPGPVYHAEQIMVSPVITASPDLPLDQAWKLLRGKHIRHLPIVAEAGRLVGMVSTSDFLRERWLDGTPIPAGTPNSPVSDLMATPVYTAEAVTDIRRIAHLLFERHIGAMPILAPEGMIIGIITRSDILKALLNNPPLSVWA